MIIHPNVIVTPDCPTVQFRQSQEQVDLDREIPRILHAQGWEIGTYFNVQFISHDRTTVLSSARFMVTHVSESLFTNETNPQQPSTKVVWSRMAEQIGDWWSLEVAASKGPGRPKRSAA